MSVRMLNITFLQVIVCRYMDVNYVFTSTVIEKVAVAWRKRV